MLSAQFPNARRGFGYTSLILAGTFAALRYETGYDWIAYEAYFLSSVDLETAFYVGIPAQDVVMEPLFEWLNILIKSVDGSFAVLLALVALFNCVTIHYVTARITDNQSFVWAIYFCLAYPIAQLSILRQALASSFILIALLLASNKNRIPAFLSTLVGIGFHVSAAIYLPLIGVANRRPHPMLIGAWLVLGCLLALGDIRLINVVVNIPVAIIPQWILEKLAVYYQHDPPQISWGAIALIAWNCGVLGIFFRAPKFDTEHDRFIRIGIWLTALVLTAHLHFAGFPNLWNRIMCVSLPWQLAALWSTGQVRALPSIAQSALVSILGAAALVGLAYTLAKPDSAPLVPYHSLLQVWLYGDEGAGRNRSEDWLKEYDAVIAQKRSSRGE